MPVRGHRTAPCDSLVAFTLANQFNALGHCMATASLPARRQKCQSFGSLATCREGWELKEPSGKPIPQPFSCIPSPFHARSSRVLCTMPRRRYADHASWPRLPMHPRGRRRREQSRGWLTPRRVIPVVRRASSAALLARRTLVWASDVEFGYFVGLKPGEGGGRVEGAGVCDGSMRSGGLPLQRCKLCLLLYQLNSPAPT